MKRQYAKRIGLLFLSAFLYITTAFTPLTVLAAPTESDYEAQAEERKKLPVQSNQIINWPDGPAISAHSAILLEANTGTILYAKNIHDKMYPASTTKLMTCLIAAENAKMDEIVNFSHDAVFSIESGSSNIGIDMGQAMPMEECLYGILVASANEVANAVAEHVGGSMDAFTAMMNDKAKELGCENTHFVNAHGLYDDNHYTSAYDLAVIAKAFFNNELLSKIGNTASYHFQATDTQPDDFITRNKHKLITGEIAYEDIKGGKTGYTDEARQTLVTCAERNGLKLICVVMMEETPDQFNDTVKLFDYGFTNFVVTNVSEHETDYQIKGLEFFHTSYDVFGNSSTLLSLNENSYIILPKTVDFTELTSEISYENLSEREVARILYFYQNVPLGMASVHLAENTSDNLIPSGDKPLLSTDNPIIQTQADSNTVFINVKLILIIIVAVAVVLIIIFVAHAMAADYKFGDIGHKSKTSNRRKIKKNRDKGPHFPSSRFKDFDF